MTQRGLPFWLALTLAILAAWPARADDGSADRAKAREHALQELHTADRCPKGEHRISLPGEPRQCWPNAPKCDKGLVPKKTDMLGQPWKCVAKTAAAGDCPPNVNCDGCPAGQHNLLQPNGTFKCVSNALLQCPPSYSCAGCPPGQHNLLQSNGTFKCVANTQAQENGSGQHSERHESNGGGVRCMNGMHLVHRAGQRPHCEP